MNFKVKCVGYNTRERYFTLGKIYDVKDGQIFCDDGDKYRSWSDFGESFENLRRWFKPWYDFELVKEDHPEIHITVKGSETIAVYKNGTEYKKAVAKCSPEDTFDFGVGAKLALERLGVLPTDPIEQKDEPKYFTGKAVFVQNRYDDAFTIGKVYEFVNGKTVDDNGHIRPKVTTGNRVTVGDKYLNLTATDEWALKFLPLVD